MITRIIFAVLVGSFLAACCSSGTTVVLVPDASGKVGKVDLTNEGGTTTLSKTNESVQIAKATQAPSKPALLSDKKIHDMFADTLTKEPTPPEHYRFYFSSGSADLQQPDADAELAKAKAAIEARKSCDLSVIGHSDTVGDNESNKGISTRRAETVAKALTGIGIASNCMDVRYYGESDPAIRTADNVDEPKNRRVEIEIR
jgi:outer membrane protein OmpA-like peptidoglycan-associated protein